MHEYLFPMLFDRTEETENYNVLTVKAHDLIQNCLNNLLVVPAFGEPHDRIPVLSQFVQICFILEERVPDHTLCYVKFSFLP